VPAAVVRNRAVVSMSIYLTSRLRNILGVKSMSIPACAAQPKLSFIWTLVDPTAAESPRDAFSFQKIV
jgi:hypothetical protein